MLWIDMAGYDMARAGLTQRSIARNGRLFLSTYIEMKNADFVLLSEDEDRLGTLAVAVPRAREEKGKLLTPPLSSILLGDRNIMIARILAEHLAKKMTRIALVSVSTKTITEKEAAPILLKLIEKTIRKEEENAK